MDFRTNNFFGKIRMSLFHVSKFLLLCRISEKTKEEISRKVGYRHTDGCTDVQTN